MINKFSTFEKLPQKDIQKRNSNFIQVKHSQPRRASKFIGKTLYENFSV